MVLLDCWTRQVLSSRLLEHVVCLRRSTACFANLFQGSLRYARIRCCLGGLRVFLLVFVMCMCKYDTQAMSPVPDLFLGTGVTCCTVLYC